MKTYAAIPRLQTKKRLIKEVPDPGIPLEAILAEFSSLRNEIVQLEQMQSSVFTLQLTAAAGVFSFSLSDQSRAGFLLLLPVLSYALTRRYLDISAGIQRLSRYIRDELSPRTHGGLAWEEWNRQQFRRTVNRWRRPYYVVLNWISPSQLVFPWLSIAALVWFAPHLASEHNLARMNRLALDITWVVDLGLSLLGLYMIRRNQRVSPGRQKVGRTV